MGELLQPVRIEDMNDVIDLARRSYPEKVREGVVASLREHQKYMQVGLDDGTTRFKVVIDEKIAGVCGLYKRGDTCPADVIWGAYFFVDPTKRNSTLAYRMGVELIETAKQAGFRMLCIDTTKDHRDYFNIQLYLLRLGFKEGATLPDYFEEGVDLLFLSLNLHEWQPNFGKRGSRIK